MGDNVHNGAFVPPTAEQIMSGTPTLEKMASFFTAPFWGSEGARWDHTDRFDVAGAPWAEICRLTAAVRKARGSQNPKNLAFAIDRLMHVHHNNGSIFNRPQVMKLGLRLSKEDLDKRASIASSQEFLPLVSPIVRRLIAATQPTRTKESLHEVRVLGVVQSLLQS